MGKWFGWMIEKSYLSCCAKNLWSYAKVNAANAGKRARLSNLTEKREETSKCPSSTFGQRGAFRGHAFSVSRPRNELVDLLSDVSSKDHCGAKRATRTRLSIQPESRKDRGAIGRKSSFQAKHDVVSSLIDTLSRKQKSSLGICENPDLLNLVHFRTYHLHCRSRLSRRRCSHRGRLELAQTLTLADQGRARTVIAIRDNRKVDR